MISEIPSFRPVQHELEMPRPTIAPLTLSLGLAMLAVGVITSPAFLVVGAGIIVAGLGLWIANLLPGRGHIHEPFVPLARRPRPVSGQPFDRGTSASRACPATASGCRWRFTPSRPASGGDRWRPGDAHTGPGLRAR